MPQLTAPLFGYLGTLRFFIEADGGDDDFLYRSAVESRRDLEGGIRAHVAEIVGNEVQVIEVHLAKGSLAVTVVLGAIGTFYVTMAQYEDFLNGMSRAIEQLKEFFSRFFERGSRNITVASSWLPSPTVTTAHQILSTQRRPLDANLLMVAYLIASNAGMLAALLWLLLRRVK